jgi:protein-S-isoprenylcysteine O-methyltransferase Ste14
MMNEKDNPNVIAPPPLIFLSGLLFVGFISWFFPIEFLPKSLAVIVGIILTVAGLTIILTAILQMRRAKTNVEPWKPTTAILDDGLYGVSRNPIYLGMILIYFGVSFTFNSFWFLPPIILVLITMHNGVILREEKYLEHNSATSI